MNASIAVQVVPKTASNIETVRIVDEVIGFIRSFGLKTEVGPFETAVEGDFDTLIDIVKGCSEIAVKAGAPSVMSYIKINYCPDGVMTIAEKTEKHKKEAST